jgi:hypothetical protein
MICTSGTSPVCLALWLVWFNQLNKTDETDQMNKPGWRTFSASC